ncbi:tetratricopeptide repeat-containing diguanylate cyclase [Massilia sp. CF038]|uniref:tetratricopeptide repeat-containing diguanylate cyclase n=1 Tax=Massilia sp. CF038 TaxID=1881045 RepID=UPI0009355D92|nr:tetratricopeptide repeat-containing diguanylate cyclase [Massilia sp. CF038]
MATTSTVSAAPPVANPPTIATLKAELANEDNNHPEGAVPKLRAALSNKDSLPLADKLWLLSKLCSNLYELKKFDEAMIPAREGLAASASLPMEHVRFSTIVSEILHETGKDGEAIQEYQKIATLLPALAAPETSRKSQLVAADAWHMAGTALLAAGQVPEAQDLLMRGLRIFEMKNDEPGQQVSAMNGLAMVYYRTGRLDDAMREQQRSIDIAERAKLPDAISRAYLRMAHYLSSAGRVDEQFQALLTARARAQESRNDYNLAVIATNLADVALQRKDYAGALQFAEQAIPLVEKSKDIESLRVCWINKGVALNRLGRPGGIAWIQRGLDAFAADPAQQDVAADVQGVLAEEYGFNRDFEKAYLAAVEHKKRSDAVRKATDLKRIAEADARYQASKKQRQIELLEQEQRGQKRFQLLGILAGALGLLTIIVLLISRIYLKRAYRSVSEMSLSDPLTGLRNRRYLASRIEEDLAQVGRQRESGNALNADVVFMMIDMDHFKSVNDVHGHAAGDALLKQFSAILLEEVRDADTVVRWGGEEFLIVAKQSSNADIHLLAERVRARVASANFDLGHGVVLHKTCSIGYVSYPFPAADEARPRWEDVVELADQCLYAAKSSGRDMWVGAVQRGPVGAMPARLDVRMGIAEALFDLQHSEGRTLAWHDGAES